MFSLISSLAILDGLWIYANKERYNNVSLHVSGENSMSGKYSLYGALIAYICIILCVHYISRPLIQQSSFHPVKASLVYGGLLGLYGYGVFNGTNLVLFSNYNPATAIIDTLWGIILLSLLSYIHFQFD
jgi:uncharacterized membrane protein